MTVENFTNKNQKGNKTLFETVMANTKSIGNKQLAAIPKELLFADDEFQRVETYDPAKVNLLRNRWSDNKMDPLRVVPHYEEYMFSIVDGFHRFLANSMRETPKENLECEIIMDLSEDPEERQKQEAYLFLHQYDEVEKLTPAQTFNAKLLLGDPAACLLKKLCEEYGITIVPTKGSRKEHVLGSLNDMLKIIESQGEGCARYIFDIVFYSGFDKQANGYSKPVVHSLKNIYHSYGDVRCIGVYLRGLSPKLFKSKALAEYPLLGESSACTLFLQDELIRRGYTRQLYVEKGRLKAV